MASKVEFTNADIAKSLKLKRQNVSKYIKKLTDSGYIYFLRQSGLKCIYHISEDTFVLHRMMKNSPLADVFQSVNNELLQEIGNVSSPLNTRQSQFMQNTKYATTITTRQYSEMFEISLASALRDLKNLVLHGYLHQCGKRKNSYFRVIKSCKF